MIRVCMSSLRRETAPKLYMCKSVSRVQRSSSAKEKKEKEEAVQYLNRYQSHRTQAGDSPQAVHTPLLHRDQDAAVAETGASDEANLAAHSQTFSREIFPARILAPRRFIAAWRVSVAGVACGGAVALMSPSYMYLSHSGGRVPLSRAASRSMSLAIISGRT